MTDIVDTYLCKCNLH